MPEHPAHISVTAALHFCKSKIIRPYLRMLSIMGLRPLTIEPPDRCSIIEVLSHYYTLQVILLMIVGYFLQYMACFRRDRGFRFKFLETENVFYITNVRSDMEEEKVCEGPVLFSFIIPSVLHLIGYLHAVAVFRSTDDDQLPSLMERVFLYLLLIIIAIYNTKYSLNSI